MGAGDSSLVCWVKLGLSFMRDGGLCRDDCDSETEDGCKDASKAGAGGRNSSDVNIGGGRFFRRDGVDVADSIEFLVSLSCGWPSISRSPCPKSQSLDFSLDRLKRSPVGGRSPLLTFSSISRSPTRLPKLTASPPLRLLPPLPLRLRFARTLPSMILALGGGCSIHLVSLLCVG